MISNTFPRSRTRIICGWRLRSVQQPQLSITLNRNLAKEVRMGRARQTYLTSGPNLTTLKSDMLENLGKFRKRALSRHDAFKKRNPRLYWVIFHFDVVFIAAAFMLLSSPFLFGWPSVLKPYIKSGTWALLSDRAEEALAHTSNAWFAIQLLPPEALSPDPNLKILKVASLRGWALWKNCQALEAFRFMSDALTLRRRRMEEERQEYERRDRGQVMSVSKEERMLVITLCLWLGIVADQLGPSFDDDANYYFAYAYAESLRLSRARSASSGKLMYTSPPLDAEPLRAVAAELGLDSEPDIFDRLNEDEIYHNSSWWQDILFQKPSAKFDRPGGNLMSLSAVRMGELCDKKEYHDLAYAFYMNAAKTAGTSSSISNRLGHLSLAFHSALSYRESQAQRTHTRIKVPSPEEVVKRCEEIEHLVNALDSKTWKGNPIGRDIFNFFAALGHAYLMSGRQEEAYRKFRRGLEIAQKRGFGQEVEEKARKLFPHLVNDVQY